MIPKHQGPLFMIRMLPVMPTIFFSFLHAKRADEETRFSVYKLWAGQWLKNAGWAAGVRHEAETGSLLVLEESDPVLRLAIASTMSKPCWDAVPQSLFLLKRSGCTVADKEAEIAPKLNQGDHVIVTRQQAENLTGNRCAVRAELSHRKIWLTFEKEDVQKKNME